MDMINQAMSGVSAAARGAGSMRRGVETAMSSMPDEDDIKEFERQHGGPYDPKSRMDRGKMGSIIADRKKPQKKKTAAEMAEEIPDLDPDVGGFGLPPIKTGRETDPEKLKDRNEIAEVMNKEEDPTGFISPGIPNRKELDRKAAEMGPDESTLEELFKTTHGGSFDPKSRLDAKKMDQIKELLSEGGDFGDLSDKKNRNRFALQIYRKFDYV